MLETDGWNQPVTKKSVCTGGDGTEVIVGQLRPAPGSLAGDLKLTTRNGKFCATVEQPAVKLVRLPTSNTDIVGLPCSDLFGCCSTLAALASRSEDSVSPVTLYGTLGASSTTSRKMCCNMEPLMRSKRCQCLSLRLYSVLLEPP